MFRDALRSIVLFCIYSCFVLFVLLFLVGTAAKPAFATAFTAAEVGAAPAATQEFAPLPPGCINGTEPGQNPPVCCISGYVFVEGRPVKGAEVSIETARGDLITVTTELQTGIVPNPFYYLDLSRYVSPTEMITLTARYGNVTGTATQHVVQPQGQRRDLVIYNANILAVAGEVQETFAPGKFRIPRDVANDSRGNIYVIDHLAYRVQVFTPDGQVLARPNWQKSLGAGPDQWAEPSGIAIDKRTDTVYIADGENQRLVIYDSDGQWKEVWDKAKLQANFFGAPFDVAVDGSGNVYVLARNIYQYDAQGRYLRQWGAPDQANSSFDRPRQIALTANNEVYVTTYGATPVYRFSSTGERLAFTNQISITFPEGIAIDAANNVYIADRLANPGITASRISQVSADGQFQKQWNYPNPNEALLHDAFGMTVYTNTLYIVDWRKDRLVRLNTQGDFLPPLGEADDSAGQLYNPHGLALMSSGPLKDHVFVADTQLALILTDTIVNRWTYTDTSKEVNWTPWKLAVDPQGRLWVMYPGAPRDLTRYTLSGDGRQLLRDGGPWKGTVGATSIFNGYVDLAVDSAANIYMADEQNNRLIIYRESTTTTLTKVAEFTSTVAFSPTTLLNPQGIAIDENDPAHPGAVVIYLSDTQNNRVLTFLFANNQITPLTAWQSHTTAPACSNQPLTTLAQPYGLVVDTAHNLYVADRGNSRVVKLDGKTGQCLASFGGRGVGSGRFSLPEGLALDSKGRLYVSDWNRSRIQHFLPMAVSAPVATIVHLSNTELLPGDTLTATASGQDGDETNQIALYEWSSDTGLLLTSNNSVQSISTDPTTTTVTALGPGIHRLQLRVQDNEGEWSASVNAFVFVERRRPQTPPNPLPTPDTTLPPLPPPTTCLPGGVWTFLLYLQADYNDNRQLFNAYLRTRSDLANLNHACIQIFMQVDGYSSSTHRYVKTAGQPFKEIAEFETEVAMDTSDALRDFLRDGQKRLPADHYYLAIADHGDGVRGIAWDHTSAADGSAYLTAAEIRQALSDPQVETIDILHLDACSMALLDVAYQMRDEVTFLIASQYLGWDFFAYADYARYAGEYPQPADLAQQIVRRYGELAKGRTLPATIAALNLVRIEAVRTGMDRLSARLAAWLNNDDPNRTRHLQVAAIRNSSQFFDSNGNFTNSPIDSYVDLVDWLGRLEAAGLNPEITMLAGQLRNELQSTAADRVIWERAVTTGKLPPSYANGATITFGGAHGLSIYYPVEGEPRLAWQAHTSGAAGEGITASDTVTYSQVFADYLARNPFDFARVSRWDEFLRAAYGTPAADAVLEAALPPTPPLGVVTVAVYLPVVMR